MARACFFRFKVAKSYCRPLANAILLNVSSFAFKSRSCVMAIFRSTIKLWPQIPATARLRMICTEIKILVVFRTS